MVILFYKFFGCTFFLSKRDVNAIVACCDTRHSAYLQLLGLHHISFVVCSFAVYLLYLIAIWFVTRVRFQFK